MQAFQSDIERFAELSAQVLGVSSDSLETHRAFPEKLGLSFPLIADDGTIRQQYGGGRVTYVIDQTGMIQAIFKGMPDNERVLQVLRGLPSY